MYVLRSVLFTSSDLFCYLGSHPDERQPFREFGVHIWVQTSVLLRLYYKGDTNLTKASVLLSVLQVLNLTGAKYY